MKWPAGKIRACRMPDETVEMIVTILALSR